MSSACCACLTVKFSPQKADGIGSYYEVWKCESCGSRFMRQNALASAVEALEEARRGTSSCVDDDGTPFASARYWRAANSEACKRLLTASNALTDALARAEKADRLHREAENLLHTAVSTEASAYAQHVHSLQDHFDAEVVRRKEAEQERDEARHALETTQSLLDMAQETSSALLEERDDARRALTQAVEALEEAERKINRQKDTISRYDDVINAMCHHEARVVVSNALVDAHNGMGRDAIEDNHGRLEPSRLLTEARRALGESRADNAILNEKLDNMIVYKGQALACSTRVRAAFEQALAESRGEVERLKARLAEDRDAEHARWMMWRGVETVCPECGGAGVRSYSDTTTWRGGAGGQSFTMGTCDHCWGSGDKHRHGPDLRLIYTKLKRAESALSTDSGQTNRQPADSGTPGSRCACGAALVPSSVSPKTWLMCSWNPRTCPAVPRREVSTDSEPTADSGQDGGQDE